mgnify:CR=1 FL=1
MTSSNRFHPLNGGELEIASTALQFRDLFKVADKAYVDIIEVLEFRVAEFIPDFRLMVRRDVELDTLAQTTIDPPRIFVKESIYDAACEGDADARRVLAHELGHLLLHQRITTPMQRDTTGYFDQFPLMNLLDSSEAQADVFARHFLIPPYLAFDSRFDCDILARRTGTSKSLSSAAIAVSKRQEMYALRQPRRSAPKHKLP